MKKADASEVVVREVAQIVGRWTPLLSLTHWNIRVSAFDDPDQAGSMYTAWEPGYRNIALRINLAHVGREMGLEQAVVHELTHMVLAPLTDWTDRNFNPDSPIGLEVRQRTETVVDTISNLFRGLHDLQSG